MSAGIYYYNWYEGPTAIIEEIRDNPSLLGEPIQFTGAGVGEFDIIWYTWASSVDGSLYDGPDPYFMMGGMTKGIHRITLQVEDSFGAISPEADVTLTIHVPPLAVIDSEFFSPCEVGTTVNFTGRGIDNWGIAQDEWESSIDGVLIITDQAVFSTNLLSVGEHEISLRVRDIHGAWSDRVWINLTVFRPDTAPPSISITFPAEGKSVSGIITIIGKASDDQEVEFVQYRMWSTGEWMNVTGSNTWSLDLDTKKMSDTAYSLQFRAYDGTNYSPITTFELKVDNEGGEDNGGGGLIPAFDVLIQILSFMIVAALWSRRERTLG